MDSWTRRSTALWVLVIGWLAAPACGQTGRWPDNMLDDAELRDVFFADVRTGWAVGDRGVIWHTVDGRQWKRQRSPVDCPLHAVWFLDKNLGWAVGGYSKPQTHRSVGVVLRTRDGGRRWTKIETLTLPRLRKVRFDTERDGWALGDGSPLFRSGVFRTRDGGRSWENLPGSGNWLAGDFWLAGGIVVGRSGEYAMATEGRLHANKSTYTGLRHLRQVRATSPTNAWLAGDGGLIMFSQDAGNQWQLPQAPLPAGVDTEFNFTALAIQGAQVWAAGSPGTRVLNSPDGGRTWRLAVTGQNANLQAITFPDHQHGWAVGGLGTILATDNGGRSWKVQRRGGSRLAMLAIVTDPDETALELFAQLAGSEGYLSRVHVVGRRDLEDAPHSDFWLPDGTHEAVLEVGGSGAESAWDFPLRQRAIQLSSKATVAMWDRMHDGRGRDRLIEHLVRVIRQWRPQLVLTHDPADGSSEAALLGQAVMSAVQAAAESTDYPDQRAVAGLQPWTVKRVIARTDLAQGSSLSVTTTQVSPHVGRSLASQATQARSLISHQVEPSPAAIGFRILWNRSRDDGKRGFFRGMELEPGGEARRETSPLPARTLDDLRRLAQQRRNIEQLLAQAEESERSPAWLGQLSDLVRGQSAEASGEILFQLADRYRASGHPQLAFETNSILLDKYPEHHLVEPAIVSMVQHATSAEVSWWLRRRGRLNQRAQPNDAADLRPRQTRPLASLDTALTAESEKPAETPGIRDAASLAREIARKWPALYAEPAVRFPLAAYFRRDGRPAEATRYFHHLAGSGTESWQACARGELWLAQPTAQSPKKSWKVLPAARRPYLDGKLDDAIWQSTAAIEVGSPLEDDRSWPATAKLAYDDKYLYVAVHAHKADKVEYATADGTGPRDARPRDATLNDRDRFELLIDIDRDFTTFYRLTVDHRGFTRDELMNDKSWNPSWYVAADENEKEWKIEAAIELAVLAEKRPAANAVWAVGMQRIVPGVGFQSASRPASTEGRGDGFGYLIFQ